MGVVCSRCDPPDGQEERQEANLCETCRLLKQFADANPSYAIKFYLTQPSGRSSMLLMQPKGETTWNDIA